jgi:branched-chain amino acid transport system permease protein
MSEFLSFTVVGLVTGCIYALIGTGLVVTYTTTGIFNFAHGAVGMFAAFAFWQLWQGWHVNPVVALVLALLVIAPAIGLVIERLLMRPLHGAPPDVLIVVSLGLLLALVGSAQLIWDPSSFRRLPQFFNGSGFPLGNVRVSWHQVIAIVATAVAAILIAVLFKRTRLGIAMRAAVDSPALLAMAGGRPTLVQQSSWALSSSLAALAGILIAPIYQFNVILLTLLVVDGYAAAIIGRLRSLPVAIAGAIGIGLGQNYIIEFASGSGGFLSRVYNILPMVVLFVALIVLPQDRLRTASFTGAVPPRVASLRSSLTGGLVLVAVAFVVSAHLSIANLKIGATGFAFALILLSLVLLTGYGGMVSGGQMAFVGLGATMMGHLGHGGSLVGVVAAVALSAGIGAAVALPTLKMRGLYLALATFAFATVMDQAVFNQILGTGGSIEVARLRIPGVPTTSDRAFFVVTAVVFAVAAVALLALRRGPFGRRLVAVNDSPAACATLGVNVNWTKLIAFTTSAGMAGLGGVMLGGVPRSASAIDFAALLSLVMLLIVRVGGINTATGALFGAFTYAVYQGYLPHLPHLLQNAYLLTGLAAISVGRDPNGFGGRVAQIAERLRPNRSTSETSDVPPQATGPAAVFLEEEAGLVHAGS